MGDRLQRMRVAPACGVFLMGTLGWVAGPRCGAQAGLATPATPAVAESISLDEAIRRARSNEPQFAAAAAASRNAALDRSIAQAALLPNVVYHNQYLYTEPSHGATNSANASAESQVLSGTPRFIANNSVHEYTSQGVVTETLGAQGVNAVSRATISAAIANAELEIGSRGLTSTVAGLFYGTLAAERKLAVAERAASEAQNFTAQTKLREGAREVAHADVVKAQLQEQQRTRDVSDAGLKLEASRLDLGVLLFPDPRTAYTLSAAATPPPVPSRADVEAALAKSNPELASALAGSQLADLGVSAARLAYLPDLSLNYAYGIDSTHFAIHDADGTRNLGYSAYATLDIPVWDWFSTQNKIKQARISRDAARAVLTNTQRRLIAELEEFYAEATAVYGQLQSLDESVATAGESLRLTRLRYTSGEATVLEVVDAQGSAVAAEQAREDGIARYQAALANLQLLTGTL